MFEEIKSLTPAVSQGHGTGVKAMLVKRGSRPTKLKMSFTEEAAACIGFTPDCRLKVFIGSGEHAGLLRLAVSEQGPAKLEARNMGGGRKRLYVAFGHLAQLPNDTGISSHVEWTRIDTQTIEFKLPPWAKPKVITRTATYEAPAAALKTETELESQNREAKERRERMGMKL